MFFPRIKTQWKCGIRKERSSFFRENYVGRNQSFNTKNVQLIIVMKSAYMETSRAQEAR